MNRCFKMIFGLLLTVCLMGAVLPGFASDSPSVALQEIARITSGNIHMGPTHTYMLQKDGQYYLMDMDGREVNGIPYENVLANNFTNGYLISDASGRYGFVLEDGRSLPCVYSDILHYGNDWMAGISKAADLVDVYFRCSLVAQLKHSDVDSSAYAFGKFLYFQKSDALGTLCVDSFGTVREYGEQPFVSHTQEYTYDDQTKTCFHPGSGQIAFSASCTLTPDDVQQCYFAEENRIYDLQGQLVGIMPEGVQYEAVRGTAFRDYLIVTKDGKEGVVDSHGNMVLEPVYDKIIDNVRQNSEYAESSSIASPVSTIKPNAYGAFIVETDHQIQFVRSGGEVLQSVEQDALGEVSLHCNTPFVVFNNQGTLTVLTAGGGLMAPIKSNCTFSPSASDLLLLVLPSTVLQNEDGISYLVDVFGNILLQSTDRLSISEDGSMVISEGQHTEVLYKVIYP